MSKNEKALEKLGKNIRNTDYMERISILEDDTKYKSENTLERKIKELKNTSNEFIDILNSSPGIDNIENAQHYLSKRETLTINELLILTGSKNKDVAISITERSDLNKEIINVYINKIKNNETVVSKVLLNLIYKQEKLLSNEDKNIILKRMKDNERLYKKEIVLLTESSSDNESSFSPM
jgi:hypothetical protein